MKKPSGAAFKKNRLRREAQRNDLIKAFDDLGEIPEYLKKKQPVNNEDIISGGLSYRMGGYNTSKLQASNSLRRLNKQKKILHIQKTYSASDYPSKKSMYIDIASKENISPRTAMHYMTQKLKNN